MGWGISFSALLLNTVLWLLLCGLLFAQEPVAAKPQSHLLVIKTKASLDHWNSDRLFTQLRSSPLGKQIRDLKRSFKRQSQWSSSPPFPYDRYVTLTLQPNSSLPKAIAELQRLESIESVQLDYELTDPAIELPSDPELPQQWYLSHLKIPQAWPLADGSGIFVADIESGFDTEHPDLVNQFDLSRSFDYDPDTDDENSVNDNKRTHGTPVCGIIAAEANNDLFGVGIAYGATLIGSQMANSYSTHISHEAWTVITAKAILGSVEQGADVILIEKQV